MYQQFYTDIRRINHMFSQLLAAVHKYLSSQSDKKHSLGVYAVQSGLLSENDERRLQYYGGGEVFQILSEYLSFLDFGPLDSIVNDQCSDYEREYLQRYHKELEVFCRRRVLESPASLGGDELTERKKLRFALDLEDPAVKRVPDKSLKVAIANILGCQASDLILHDIRSPGKIYRAKNCINFITHSHWTIFNTN